MYGKCSTKSTSPMEHHGLLTTPHPAAHPEIPEIPGQLIQHEDFSRTIQVVDLRGKPMSPEVCTPTPWKFHSPGK